MEIATIVFYLFSLVLIGSALAVVVMRNPVHSVLFLILAFFNAAGLFVLLGAEFLAMLLVIVYVGAVAVLFLFVVMMLNVTVESFRKGLSKYFPLGVIVAAILLAEMIALVSSKAELALGKTGIAETTPQGITNTKALGQIIYTDYIFAFQTSGLILLVAMIGAIVLTFTPRHRMRKQVISKQVARNPKQTMEIVKVESGQGANT